MKTPTIVLCGRPNVGKSSLFNALLRRKVAIVDPTPGVTRDRVEAVIERRGRALRVVDTGGVGGADAWELLPDVEAQIETALALADLVVLVVDAKEGLTPADREVARRLRRLGRPVVVAANKCDGVRVEREAIEFTALGFGDPVALSARTRRGVEDLVDRVLEQLPEHPEASGEAEDARRERPLRVAVVGKVNSGKSTLVNRLSGEDRVIVSPMPGTTRDAVDVEFELGGRRFVAVDTAGLRKRRVVEGKPDFYAQARAESAILRSQAVVFLLDATREISQVDKAIGRRVAESGRPVVLALSKWDLAEAAGRTLDAFEPYVRRRLPMLDFAPLSALSATEGTGVEETFSLLVELHAQSGHRVGTGELNRVVARAMERRFPRVGRSKVPKLRYVTQTGVHPPTFVVFVNDRRLFGDEYRRYLARRLRVDLPFGEVPLRIVFRDQKREEPAPRPR